MSFDTPRDKWADAPVDEAGAGRGRSGLSKEIWVSVITAGGTIAAALITAAVAIGTGAASVPGLDGSPSVSSLQRTIASLEQDVSTLNAENEQLSGQVGDLTAQLEATGETPVTTGSTATADVARSTDGTPIGLYSGSCLDLDSTAANWGVPEGDFCIDHGDDITTTSNTMTILDEAPDAATCAAQTLVTDFVSDAQTLLGKHLCVVTSSGRYADVSVVSVDEAADAFALEITVWK
ncbi:hypothetical protein L1785_18245 [Antribacter sp. KLBMP9083]|uniref:Uncharacterized protein n=1 Tax=Antribacter soli TaxID=2910976 RepID=A0AA41QIP1_9MICO|nr:hypothetical protein [Antribacter soli]MCF4122922.1 hypothetical protein [Antribacter soli]